MITCESVEVGVQVSDWEEAVRHAGRLLVCSGAARTPYIEAMVRLTRELGPYIVITPGIAIPHARPEEGAEDVGFSVVQLDPAIPFGNPENDPVSLVIGFCSPNADAHVELLMEIARIIGQEDFLAAAKKASTAEELASLFNRPISVA